MGKFSKIKKYSKPSLSVNERIDKLNNELKKTGMISEIANNTSDLYSVTSYTEPVPAVPPTYSDVPDTSGITGGSFTQNDVTNDNTGYNDISQLFNANIGDNPTPIIQTPPATPVGGVGLVWHSYTLNGDAVGYIGPGNKFKQVLNPSISGGTDTSYAGDGYRGPDYFTKMALRQSFASAFIVAPHRPYNMTPGTYITWQCWLPYNPYGFGALYNDYTGIKKTDAEGNWGLANVVVGISRNTYQSDPGSPYHPGYYTLISKNRLGDPEYSPLPGTILSMLNKSRLSKEAFRSLVAGGYSLRPDGTMGFSKVGDRIKGNDGREYELVPRPGYGYNQWVPVKQASAGSNTQIAGVPLGTGGMIDIDDRGWYVTPDQLLKMHQNPSRYNLSPKDQKKIKSWVTNLKLAHFEPQGELISEDRKKILPEKLQHIDFDEIADLEEFGKALSASQLIMLEKNLLKYIEENPEQIEALRKRYPISDPRLSELNYKLDKMVGASDEYLETQFPQNQKLFNKVQETIKKNIKLTDPKNFKTIKDPVTYEKLLPVNRIKKGDKSKNKLRLKNKNTDKKTPARFLKKPKIKTNEEVLNGKIKQLDLDMKKTMGNLKEEK